MNTEKMNTEKEKTPEVQVQESIQEIKSVLETKVKIMERKLRLHRFFLDTLLLTVLIETIVWSDRFQTLFDLINSILNGG